MNSQISIKARAAGIVLTTLVFLLAAATCGFAQTSGDLSNLRKHINQQVTVDTQDGPVTGQLLRVEDSRIVVYEAGRPKPIAFESVKSVTRHKSRHAAAWVVGMSAAGLGAGFLLGFRGFDDATNANGKIGAAGAAGAGAGAAAGYALSRVGKRDQVIYRSEK
jgi:hypothetical protein